MNKVNIHMLLQCRKKINATETSNRLISETEDEFGSKGGKNFSCQCVDMTDPVQKQGHFEM